MSIAVTQRKKSVAASSCGEQTALHRFEQSMVIDFDKWQDGVGYDLAALRSMSLDEKAVIEAMLLRRGARDWRDIEALACLNTPAAREVVRAAIHSPNLDVRNAVTRCAPDLIPDSVRTASLVQALQTANIFGGLAQTLAQVVNYHPPLIVEALLRGALGRGGEVAMQFSAMLCYLHDQAAEPFDLRQEAFFNRFNTDNRTEREMVFHELCEKIGVDAMRYLPKGKYAAASLVLAEAV